MLPCLQRDQPFPPLLPSYLCDRRWLSTLRCLPCLGSILLVTAELDMFAVHKKERQVKYGIFLLNSNTCFFCLQS